MSSLGRCPCLLVIGQTKVSNATVIAWRKMEVLSSAKWMKDDMMSSMKLLAVEKPSASGDILIGRALARFKAVTLTGVEI